MRVLLGGIGRLFTATPQGVIARAAVLLEGDRIVWAGPEAELPAAAAGVEREDLGGGLVTPGLVDAHTHLLYAGDRMAEIAMRSRGATYSEVAAMGGGIRATVAATRAASADALEAAAAERLARWPAGGATTVEVKTGYHLEKAGELMALGVLARLAARPDLPRLERTFLGAHAVPPEFEGRQADYAAEVASWSADAAASGARFADVFCDQGYFSVAESRLILEAGTGAGLIPRLHADEIARTGGARLAAEIGAAAADHLLRVGTEDCRAMAAAGVVGTLCPGTALSMRATPPAREMLAAGMTLALGTDHNPGTSGLTSMSLVVALAVAVLGLSVDQALTAATAGGAASLRAPDRGAVEAGRAADLVLWDAEHEGALAWAFGLRPLRVWKGGAELAATGRAA